MCVAVWSVQGQGPWVCGVWMCVFIGCMDVCVQEWKMCGCARVCNGVFVEYLRIYIGTQCCATRSEVISVLYHPGRALSWQSRSSSSGARRMITLVSCLSYHLPDSLARVSGQPYTAMVIVPTGIGAAIGGYAGDALPVARAFTAVADRVITHPNVMNGAQLYWPDPKLLYVEGYALDQFATGRTGLRPVTSQRVGLLLDAAIEPELRLRHLQAADACRATLGINVAAHVVTDAPLGVEIAMSPAGTSQGPLTLTLSP